MFRVSGWRAPWEWALMIFAIALAIRCGIVGMTRQYLEMNRFEMVREAVSMAQTGTLGNPWRLPSGPSAHCMPVYPLLLAGVFWLFGTGVGAEIVKQSLTCVLSSLQWGLMPLLAGPFGLPRRAMILAGFAGALLPVKWRVDTLGDWEGVPAALGMIGLSALTVVIWREGRFGWRTAAAAGAAWGTGILLSAPFVTAAAAVVLAGLVYFRGRERVAWLRFGAIAGLAAGLMLVPWVIRNAVELGSPVLTRSNFGLELYVSFNNRVTVRQQNPGSEDFWMQYHPMFGAAEMAEAQQYGEVEYNRRKLASAKAWIESHPGATAELIAGRFVDYWFPRTRSVARSVLWATLTLLGYVAAPLIWRTSKPTAIVLASITAGYSPVYFLEITDPRYKYPVDWIIFLGIGMVTSYVIGRMPGTDSDRASEQNIGLAGTEA